MMSMMSMIRWLLNQPNEHVNSISFDNILSLILNSFSSPFQRLQSFQSLSLLLFFSIGYSLLRYFCLLFCVGERFRFCIVPLNRTIDLWFGFIVSANFCSLVYFFSFIYLFVCGWEMLFCVSSPEYVVNCDRTRYKSHCYHTVKTIHKQKHTSNFESIAYQFRERANYFMVFHFHIACFRNC